jgi:hypothetical protein
VNINTRKRWSLCAQALSLQAVTRVGLPSIPANCTFRPILVEEFHTLHLSQSISLHRFGGDGGTVVGVVAG